MKGDTVPFWKTRLYRIWSGIKTRCYNPNDPHFARWGARGITMCEEWKDNFQAFREWAISNGYAENLTIDRKDNDKGYAPENCKWSTNREQCNNRSHHVLLEINGQTKTISQWSQETGLKYRTIHARHERGLSGMELIKPVEGSVLHQAR